MGESVQKTIFGDWLRKKIDDRGMTISAVARMSGFSREHLYKIMSGDSGTKIETVDAMSKAIGVSSKEARDAWYSSMAVSSPIQGGVVPGFNVQEPNAYTYPEQKGGVVKFEMLSADMFIKLTQDVGFLKNSVEERLNSIELRLDHSPPTTIVDLDGKGGQKVTEISGEIGLELQKQIAELNAKMDEVLEALATKKRAAD